MTPAAPGTSKDKLFLGGRGDLLSISTSRGAFRGPLVLLAPNEIALSFSLSSKQREGALTSWQKASGIACTSCLITIPELWAPPEWGTASVCHKDHTERCGD